MAVATFLLLPSLGQTRLGFLFCLTMLVQQARKRKEKMKRIEANKIIKTLNWIAQADEDGQSVLEPKLNKKGIYECEIHLPLIEKTVIGLGDDKLESIDNATQQTSKLIDEYLEDYPETTIRNIFGDQRYVLEEDDGGYLCIHLIQTN